MTNEKITQTIQQEIQQAQQPLLERIDELEQQVDLALDHIVCIDVMMGQLMQLIPSGYMGTAAKTMRACYESLPPDQQAAAPARNLLFWVLNLEKQDQARTDITLEQILE